MYYINSASTVSHQNTFLKKGFSETLTPLDPASELIQPNYKDYIDAGLLRRMSEIIRISICCSKDCMLQSAVIEPSAIIVGTGLGCLTDTEKFIKDFVSSTDQLLSPTPFIQSTHNTIAGQLSLILKNHNYNITHTQNTLSFEHALQDALLCLGEGKDIVLVGAADERVDALDEFAVKFGYKDLILTSGASFFIVSGKKNEYSKIRINATTAHSGNLSITSLLQNFVEENKIQRESIDLVLYSSIDKTIENKLNLFFNDKLLCNYQTYCGTYFSNSAFALHLGMDVLERGKAEFISDDHRMIKRVLIFNNLNSTSLGLTLLESLEA
jgi:hypothetical protein